MSAEIEEATEAKVQLIAGGGGIFEIRRDDKVLWKKHRGGDFPTKDEIKALFQTEIGN